MTWLAEMYHVAPRKTTPQYAQNPQFQASFSSPSASRNALISLKNLRLHDIFSSRNFLMSYIKPGASLVQAPAA
ncbi:hypothetical protein [Comamonas resistens]|uniref:Uncharacterized protein n=1 Tax=Comamonas resistens TaxID=3046670 RepID=A0ABY8SW82_9BURK|nr:hypothetical protein [Comamonas resistens]MDL5037426.1 hypothetical protein [Comamonas resistens]WHS65556.1 hypothetical protein QMY55_24390 [Comamonas resistens]